MTPKALKITFLFLCTLLAQVLIGNNIVLFYCAVPMIFIYFIVRAPLSLPINGLLSLSFLMGFLIDISTDTPGVNALSCTILAMIKRPVVYAYIQHDDRTDDLTPSIRSLGSFAYMKYLLTMTVIYCTISFSVEYFSYTNLQAVILSIAASSLLTFIILLGIDSIMIPRNEKRL